MGVLLGKSFAIAAAHRRPEAGFTDPCHATPKRGDDVWVAPLGWSDDVGQAGPGHLRLRGT
jgi:hypothetical protein